MLNLVCTSVHCMYVHVSTCIYLKFAAASDEEARITGMDTEVIQVQYKA